jgi:hypothetical protein
VRDVYELSAGFHPPLPECPILDPRQEHLDVLPNFGRLASIGCSAVLVASEAPEERKGPERGRGSGPGHPGMRQGARMPILIIVF